ncbi:MFS transporter [Actinoplanes oblitus]|uniref:MFS transporter n=1 Tax=Actinoplanes oblitus TaxID=3040509 RepID=A0ABY8W7X1_9ACTN|nr:MFS transporter [Actinoplanes oblitus]WIM93936.1 MFS transporter [Actinoplanes oblitus]
MKQFNDQLANLWQDYAALVSLAGGLLGVVLLISFAIWAKRSGKPLRPIALSFSMNLALLLNAEGMWVIATEQLHLPKVFAILVFAVFEICFLTATSLAAEQYRNTSVYGPDGKIETPGHPGPMLWIAALIAAVSGIIVASNAVTGTEKLLRLAVPCVIFLMWWAALTAAGQRVRRGRFAYSPRRLAERWGWLIPDDDPDLTRMAAERQVRRMVVNHHRVSSARWPRSWWRNRLLKDARTAGEPVVDEVIGQLARIQRVMDLLIPADARPATPVIAAPAPVAAATVDEPATAPLRTAPPVQFVPPAPVIEDVPVRPTVAKLAALVNSTAETPSLGERLAAAVTPEEMLGMPAPEATAPVAPVAPVAPAAPVPAPRRPEEEATVPGAVPAVLGSIPAAAAPRPFLATTPVPQANGNGTNGNGNGANGNGNGANGNGTNGGGLPSWAATPTGAQRAVNIVGSPWWRLAVERLSRLVADEITADNLSEMTYTRVAELVRTLAPRVPDLGEGVVRSFVNDYVREMNGEPGDAAFPWRDLLPDPVTAPVGSPAWMAAIEELRAALIEEMEGSDVTDPRELAMMLAPSVPRLDDETIREFVSDYLSALGGQPTGGDQPWQHLLPRPQGGRGPSDEEIVEQFGPQLHEHLRTTGRLTRYRVTAVTGVKSQTRADRIKTIIEDQAAESAPA